MNCKNAQKQCDKIVKMRENEQKYVMLTTAIENVTENETGNSL